MRQYNRDREMVVVGLTGGICSGKSTVARLLGQMGATVINADQIGHEAYSPHSETWQQIVDAFGREILTADDKIDRNKLGDIVFNDPNALRRLNEIMHPVIRRLVEEKISELKQKGDAVVVLEAPLLIEANWLDLVDEVWVTKVSEANALKRCRERSGLSEAQARVRIASQLPFEERVKHADVVIDTDVGLAEVEARVRELWQKRFGKRQLMTKESIRKALARHNKKLQLLVGYAPAAVMLPLFERDGEYYLLFTKRTETVNYHKGQIAFPGGRPHSEDKSLLDTAMRETWEEIGLHPKDVEVLGELDDIVTYTTNFVISPFVASIPAMYKFKVNPAEVQEIIEVPLSALLDESNLEEETLDIDGRPIVQYFYHYGDRVIYGATARIVKQFLEVINPPHNANGAN